MPVAYSWSPDNLDAFGFQELDRFAHVSDFQGNQVIAKMDARRSRRNVCPFIRDEFNRRAAQLQICEIDRHAGARPFKPILVSQFEAEDLSIELDCLFRLIGDDFDVINSLEHGTASDEVPVWASHYMRQYTEGTLWLTPALEG